MTATLFLSTVVAAITLWVRNELKLGEDSYELWASVIIFACAVPVAIFTTWKLTGWFGFVAVYMYYKVIRVSFLYRPLLMYAKRNLYPSVVAGILMCFLLLVASLVAPNPNVGTLMSLTLLLAVLDRTLKRLEAPVPHL